MPTANTQSMMNFCVGLLVVVVLCFRPRYHRRKTVGAPARPSAGRLPQHIDNYGAGMDGQG